MKKIVCLLALCIVGVLFASTDQEIATSLENRLIDPTVKFHIEKLSDNNFTPIVSNGDNVIDCFADWCGPCRSFAPIFEKVAWEMRETLGFYKANIDECPVSVSNNKLYSIPTVLFFRNGQEVDRHVGYCDEATLREFVLTAMTK